MISSCAILFLILTSLLFHNLTAAPIFADPPAQPPAITPSPAPISPSSKPSPPPPVNPPPLSPSGEGGSGENGPRPSKKKSGSLSGGQTAGVVIGILAALGLLILGSLVYKKRQSNIKRGRFGSAARRASL